MPEIKLTSMISKGFLHHNFNDKEKSIYQKELLKLKENLAIDNTEETNKNYIRDFLRHVGFDNQGYYVDPIDRYDLVIGKNNSNRILIETKKFDTQEMITKGDLNRKALQETILYFMRERVTNHNNQLTYSIVTNGVDWFIFDASSLNRLFAKDKNFVSKYKAIAKKQLTDSSTSAFYNEIAKPKINEVYDQLTYSYFNLNDAFYKNGAIKWGEASVICKMLSPLTLLKQSYVSFTTQLNKHFYDELLYILGLEEKQKSKGIERLPKNRRQNGTLVELIYTALLLNNIDFKNETEEFDYVINVVINYTNRILFLKLLESQLKSFNQNSEFSFMSHDKIHSFNQLSELFFGVMVRPENKRGPLTEKYKNVPYLNSSLFERSDVEDKLRISPSDLNDNVELPLFKNSVLKKRVPRGTRSLPTLQYLLQFLEAYDFETQGSNGSKEIINASVLGLIFEKINGYKDGSFYTPSFVTSYLSKQSIDQALVNKFRKAKWDVNSIDDIYNSIRRDNKDEALQILRDFKLVDPAVGSGHFLVSAMNYLIKLRYDFDMVSAELSRSISINVVNDELVITYYDQTPFQYERYNSKSAQIQKELFNIKLDIIEHNLFGVDINQNSVNITRLRLWIELLKNSYYENDELRTMPNLEMNVKAGNSVVFKYDLDANLGDVVKSTHHTVSEFKSLVQKYKYTDDKNDKHKLQEEIDQFKNSIVNNVLRSNDKRRLLSLQQEKNRIINEVQLAGIGASKRERNAHVKELDKKIDRIKDKLEEVKRAPIFANSFEWRFEFPEVLNDRGQFIGFDLVVANPPYIGMQGHREIFEQVAKTDFGRQYTTGKMDFLYYFYFLAINILARQGVLGFITTRYWLTASNASLLRSVMLKKLNFIKFIDFDEFKIFSSAKGQHNLITIASKEKQSNDIQTIVTRRKGMANTDNFTQIVDEKSSDPQTVYSIIKSGNLVADKNDINYFNLIPYTDSERGILEKLDANPLTLGEIGDTKLGITTGKNPIFLWNKQDIDAHNEFNEKEKSLFKPHIKASSLTKPIVPQNNDDYLLYMTKDVVLDQIPHIKKWIESQPEFEGLSKRRDVVKGRYRAYDLSWPRDPKLFESGKAIIFQKREVSPMFSLDTQSYFMLDDGYSYTLNDKHNSQRKRLIIHTILNSIITHFFLAAMGRKKGRSLELYPEVINAIPVPELNSILINENQLLSLAKGKDIKEYRARVNELVSQWYGFDNNDIKLMKEFIKKHQY